LLFEPAALSLRLRRISRRGALPDVGHLTQEARRYIHRIDVVVANEENLPVVGRELRVVLCFHSLGEASDCAGGEIVDVDVAVELDNGVPAVVRALGRRESIAGRVRLLNRYPLGLCARHRAHAELLRRLTPVGARLEPGEVDPLAVRAPVDVVRMPAIQLRPAHDVLDGEVEWPGLLRANRLRGKQHKEP